MALVMIGCAPVDEVEVASNGQALLGGLTFMDQALYVCSASQQALLRAAWERGRRAALSPEFEACMRKEMSYDYLACQGRDPFEYESRDTQMNRAIEVSRSANYVRVGCSNSYEGTALAYTWQFDSYYHTSDESMVFTSSYLDSLLALNAFNVETEGWLAGIFWHEAMHTHGYLHDAVGNMNCGYGWNGDEASFPTAQFSYSVNEIAHRCIQEGALANSTTLRGIALARRLAPGVYGPEVGEGVTQVRLAPGTGVTLCPTCGEYKNAGITELVAQPPLPLSYVRIVPRVTVFDHTQYGGRSASLGIGVHPVTDLGGAIGNDAIRSMFVPAGVVVYACSDDYGGRGGGRCHIFEGPAADTSWMGGISYLEIMPRVTTFADTEFYGSRQSFGLGGSPVSALPQVRSIIVVPGQTAVACTAPPGTAGRFCRTFTNSAPDVGPELAGKLAYLEISSAVPPSTYHVSASATGGVVTSDPWGISCGEACSASFPAGSQLTLVAVPAEPGATVTWQGCDSIVNGNCALTVSRDRTATATFKAACDPAQQTECENGCSDACAYRKSGFGTCLKSCLARCSTTCN